MCRICEELGDGKKWLFNPRNHYRNIYKVKRHKEKQTGWEDAEVLHYDEIQGALQAKWTNPDIFPELMDECNKALQKLSAAQVTTMEECDKVIDMSQARGIMMCNCRKITRAAEETNEHEYTCLALGIGIVGHERWPERYRGGVKLVSRQEAKDFIRRMRKKGYMQMVMCHGPVDNPWQIGGLCNCSYPECGMIRHRIDYGLKEAHLYKSHYVAKIDNNLCVGCRECISRCQFHAMNYNVYTEKAHINMFQCFGCELCADTCPQGAITMVERESIPVLKEVW